MDKFDPINFLAYAIVIFLGIGLHEYAHCKAADLAGDPTARNQGRVTLDLTKHFELAGTIMMLVTYMTGFGIGWGKPAPMDPSKMKNPRWDFFVAVLAGPVSNLVQATFFAVILRILFYTGLPPGPASSFIIMLVSLGVLVNIGLMLFNLLPFGILDGHYILGVFLPERARFEWYRFNRSYGFFLLIGVILIDQSMGQSGMLGPLDYLLYEPTRFLTRLLTGVPV